MMRQRRWRPLQSNFWQKAKEEEEGLWSRPPICPLADADAADAHWRCKPTATYILGSAQSFFSFLLLLMLSGRGSISAQLNSALGKQCLADPWRLGQGFSPVPGFHFYFFFFLYCTANCRLLNLFLFSIKSACKRETAETVRLQNAVQIKTKVLHKLTSSKQEDGSTNKN